MPTALRNMQPWRRSLVEHGLTLAWLAQQTGRSPQTVQSYAMGRRNPPASWLEQVEAILTAQDEAVWGSKEGQS